MFLRSFPQEMKFKTDEVSPCVNMYFLPLRIAWWSITLWILVFRQSGHKRGGNASVSKQEGSNLLRIFTPNVNTRCY